jgi:hypothetical protein
MVRKDKKRRDRKRGKMPSTKLEDQEHEHKQNGWARLQPCHINKNVLGFSA